MEDDFKKSVLSTVCYYDVLNYPLTLFEIWKHLLATGDEVKNGDKKVALKDVLLILKEADLQRFIDSKKGMYFLKGRDGLVENRVRRNKISILKIRKMKKTIDLLKIAPFVRMILVTGKLAMKNAHPKSDWDVLVVLKENRIWIGRTFITLWAHFLGRRRHHDRIRNRVCLNYFITTNSLEIRNKDLYSASEYFFCFPLFDKKNYFQKFQIRNHWIRKYKPNYYLSLTGNLLTSGDTKISKFCRALLENLFDWNFLEKYLEKIETKKIKENPKTNNENSLIDADKSALIFLPNPQGPKVFEKFKNKMQGFRL
ncbi:MAG: hypothetical protein ACD_7C00543G0003 [uncultured bacterium]|nr:MAG: hypothetical protein ACD_7C00543G0003 [uncultured bacterium]